ncbi:MAG: AAA family ATPase [Leptospiraceae bacterium]|nr:AAA family ATPase [Leptospiraceae bacterium]
MDLQSIKIKLKDVVKELEPCVNHYLKNYYDLGDAAKRFMKAEALLQSEIIRIGAYLHANKSLPVETLEIMFLLLKELDPACKHPSSIKQDIDLYISNTKSIGKNLEISSLELPVLMKVVRYYDFDHLSNKFDIVSNYLFQLLNLMVKSDNRVTDTEKFFLDHYRKVLHEPIPELEKKYRDSMPDISANISSIYNDFFSPAGEKKKLIYVDDPREPKKEEPVKDEIKNKGNVVEPELEEEKLEDLLLELEKLIGLKNVKEEVTNLVNILKVEKIRKEKNLPIPSRSLHMVFTGNPGTGKTTIARLIARVFRSLGILEKGHLVETDRSGLVAGFVGQTATKTLEVCQKALGGVLFIDEAYALSEGGENDFGTEAINTLLKYMEDNRNNFIAIVAGYTNNMKRFIEKNPGLQSRFNKYIEFPDYTPEELLEIFHIFVNKSKLILTKDAKEAVLKIFREAYEKRDDKFGNGRMARNLFEKVYSRQANRLVTITELNDEILCTIEKVDISEENKEEKSSEKKTTQISSEITDTEVNENE